MSYTPTRSLLTRIARLLADNNAGVYKTDTPYAATDTGIVMKTMPDKPDRCIVINWIPADSSPTMPHVFGILQVACRGKPDNPLDSDDLADSCSQWLDGLTNLTLDNGAAVVQCWARNTVNMGQDDSKRWTTATQYNLDLDLPPTLLRPMMGAW
jgi:hypothetical protein